MNPERTEHNPASLEEQFDQRETLELSGEKVEVVDIKPETQKTEVPVVMAPGWVATPESLRANILKLAEAGRRVVSIDAPHGIDAEKMDGLPQAEVRNIAALMETLDSKGIEKTDAIGHSEGGMYLVMAATLYPERFRNLVLVNPSGMIGKDRPDKMIGRFSLDWVKQVVNDLRDPQRLPLRLKANKESATSIKADFPQTLRELAAISGTQIHEMLSGLKEKGIGISIIHTVDDKLFPMKRVQEMTNWDMIDGFYSIKGTHNEVGLKPDVHSKLMDQALDALEKKK